MAELFDALWTGIQALSGWEATAVLLAIAYLLLVIRQNAFCWPAAILSAAIYGVLFFDARLYMQSLLQGFYIAMAVYGWWNWTRGAGGGGALPVIRWAAKDHRGPLAIILLTGLVIGWVLAGYSDAAHPYLDALAATAAIVTTWMVARKVLQNWHYWFVIDSVSIYLYASQGLWLTAALFLVYLVLVVVGFQQWRATLDARG